MRASPSYRLLIPNLTVYIKQPFSLLFLNVGASCRHDIAQSQASLQLRKAEAITKAVQATRQQLIPIIQQQEKEASVRKQEAQKAQVCCAMMWSTGECILRGLLCLLCCSCLSLCLCLRLWDDMLFAYLPSNLMLAWHHLPELMQDACNLETCPATTVAFRDLNISC